MGRKAEFEKIGKRVVSDIRKNMDLQKRNASGDTREAFEYRATDNLLEVSGLGHSFILEVGRGPTGSGSLALSNDSRTLYEKLVDWIQDKGITPKKRGGQKKAPTIEQVARAMANVIHRKGTELFRFGGAKSGVISTVINDELIDEITKLIADSEVAEFARNIIIEK